ncbi:MAG: TonB-dependent receptor [Planctomycetota bacterium]|nr:TonB-dependent receptor [Planctomycetota bacterium]
MTVRWLHLALAITLAYGALWAAETTPPPPAAKPSEAADAKAPTTQADKAGEIPDYAITVTATRSAVDVFRAPYTVEVISADEIAHRKNSDSLVDALAEVPGVMLQKTSPGQGSPFIRGFTGYQTLLLIDGVRFNNSTFRSGPNEYWRTIDPLSLDRLELVKGPFSALYGSDAVGGTVNAITKSPRWGDGEHIWQGIDWGGRTYYRGASAERSNIGHLELEGSYKKKVAFLFTGSYKDYDDLKAGGGAGVQQNTGFSEFGADGKIIYRIADDHDLTFLGQHYRQQEVPRTEQTVYTQSFHGSAIGTEFRRDTDENRGLGYVEYHGKDISPILADVKVNLNYQNHHEERNRITSNHRNDISGFDVDTLGALAQLQTKTAFGTLTYGLDYYHDRVESFRYDFNADGSPRSHSIQGPLGDNASYDLFGAFIQNDTWLLNDRLNIVGGLRFSYAAARAGQVEDPVDKSKFSLHDSWKSVVGNARVLYLFDKEKHWNVFGGASQAFRAPTLYDLTAFDATGQFETPSPGLTPEQYLQFEAGVKGDYDFCRFTGSYFYTLISDQITPAPTGNIIQDSPEVVKSNVGKGWLQGIETRLEYTFYKQWTPWADFTWQEGETNQMTDTEKVRAPISRLMPPTGHLGLRYRPRAGKWWVEAVGTFVGKQDRLSVKDLLDTRRIPPGGTPGCALLGIRGSAQLARRLFLSGGVENVTNQNYRVHGSGTNQPGVNAYLSIDWKF